MEINTTGSGRQTKSAGEVRGSESVGELYYNTGERYEGEWQDNKKHGQGTLYYANGDVYEAVWLNGKPTGKGKLIHANVKKISREEELTKNQSNSDSAEDLKETYDDVCNN